MQQTIKIKVDDEALDTATEKAERLVGLLREAQQIISSLSEKNGQTMEVTEDAEDSTDRRTEEGIQAPGF